MDVHRLLAHTARAAAGRAGFRALDDFPLEESVGGDDAALLAERVSVCILLGNSLGARVDHLAADRQIFGPERHETPTQMLESPLVVSFDNGIDLIGGCDVVTRL